jgi:hypothetical protein
MSDEQQQEKVTIVIRNKNKRIGSRVLTDVVAGRVEINAGETKQLEVSPACAAEMQLRTDREIGDLEVLKGVRAERALEGAKDIDEIDEEPASEAAKEPVVNEELEAEKQEVAKRVRRQLKG